MSTFPEFDLLPSLQATLLEKELVQPTEIQSRTIPLLLSGKSIVGVAQTGSGKTLAYALPVLHLLKSLENNGDPVRSEGHPRAIIVVPTRELGEQVAKVFKPFTHTTRLRVRSVLGGTTFEMARRNVSGIFEILVATPGRLVKLIQMNRLQLSDVRVLVFDEADQMLDSGFLTDANKIVSACPTDRQMVLFSATVPKKVEELIETLFKKAVMVRSEGSHRTVSTLKTVNEAILDGKRFPALTSLIREPVQGGTIIFTNTRDQCDKLAKELAKENRACVIYRGEMDKIERRKNLKEFREGRVDLLISTDLASRGLDVEHVGRVINYHMPQQMENYIHRVGRTARAGRAGLVINFVTDRDQVIMAQLESVNQPGKKLDLNSGPAYARKEKIKPVKRIGPTSKEGTARPPSRRPMESKIFIKKKR